MQLVITAAHCIQSKNEAKKRKADDATFYLGKHSLESLSEKNYLVSGVSQFIIHPEWNFADAQYDADIAIAVLFRTITFTKFVKPICLWTATTSYKDIVGRSGVVAGWGKTETEAISTEQPKWTEIPVVDELTCLKSDRKFIHIVSSRTFCAGSQVDDSGPCNGDSGKSDHD